MNPDRYEKFDRLLKIQTHWFINPVLQPNWTSNGRNCCALWRQSHFQTWYTEETYKFWHKDYKLCYSRTCWPVYNKTVYSGKDRKHTALSLVATDAMVTGLKIWDKFYIDSSSPELIWWFTFLYGSENWTLTASQRQRIEAAEMKLLRPLAGYTLYDHKTNNSIRKELRITSILDKIDEYRKKWLLHIQRMPQNRIPLKSYNYRPQGRRSIGRPKKRSREQL